MEYLDALKRGRAQLVDTGLPDLDYAIGGGVEPGEMVLIAGRPSHGKSAVALQWLHQAARAGIHGLIISQEMSARVIGRRTVQYATDIPQEHWLPRIGDVRNHLDEHFSGSAPTWIVESCPKVVRAAEVIRQAVAERGVQVAAVDYAQLLSGKGKSRYEEITNVSVVLRNLTNELHIVVLVLCQLNREIESRKKFVPLLSDLRDSGQLEQDADVIVFVVWPHRVDSKRNPHEFQFFIGKNRNRAINQSMLTCQFEPARQMFLDQPLEGFEGTKTQYARDWTNP